MSTTNNETLQEENERLREENQELREKVEKLTDQVDDLARRVSMLEGEIRTAEPDSADETPTPQGSETGSQDDERTEVTDILARQDDEELKEKNKSMTIRIAAEIERNLGSYSVAAQAGKVVNKDNDLRNKVELSLSPSGSVKWKQVHRAMEYLARESTKWEEKDHDQFGRIAVRTSSSVGQAGRGR